MSRGLLNKGTWVLLAVTATVINSAEPGAERCPRADLDGDCDVDLRDYAEMQNAFTGPLNAGFDVLGTWDVFLFHLDYLPPNQNEYFGTFIFYGNGVVNLPNTSALYETDGRRVTIDYGLAFCCVSDRPFVFEFVNPNVLESEVVSCFPIPPNYGRCHLRGFRRP